MKDFKASSKYLEITKKGLSNIDNSHCQAYE